MDFVVGGSLILDKLTWRKVKEICIIFRKSDVLHVRYSVILKLEIVE